MLDSYKLDYLTFFNVGSHGDFGGNEARTLFNNRYVYLKKYADKSNIEFIKVDSNISEILNMNFAATHTLRNISVALLLQKLFNIYYYSSSGLPVDDFIITNVDTAHYDILLLKGLETESMSFYSTGCLYTRFEKTRNLINFEPSYEFLNVCVNPNNVKNCGVCHKCLRTLLTLDVLNALNLYHGVFDIETFKKNRTKLIGKMLFLKHNDWFILEIFKEYQYSNIKIPITSYAFSFIVYLKFIGIKLLHKLGLFESTKKLVHSITKRS